MQRTGRGPSHPSRWPELGGACTERTPPPASGVPPVRPTAGLPTMPRGAGETRLPHRRCDAQRTGAAIRCFHGCRSPVAIRQSSLSIRRHVRDAGGRRSSPRGRVTRPPGAMTSPGRSEPPDKSAPRSSRTGSGRPCLASPRRVRRWNERARSSMRTNREALISGTRSEEYPVVPATDDNLQHE
jgi:hypothetical protein